MEAFANYLFRIPRMILLLSLVALACLPIALGSLVRDASLSLLLTLTLLGALLAWGLARWSVRRVSAGIILLLLGPLALFVRIGQLGKSLSELVKQTFYFVPPLIDWLRFQIPFDPSGFVLASDDLTQRFLAFGGRLFAWTSGLWQGVHVEDPLIRSLMWSLSLWLIAVWAGWQIFHHRRLLAGMIPATLLIALVLDYTGKEIWIFWIHLSLLVFLYGLNRYAALRERWDMTRVDYSDSTGLDTLLIAGALTLGLVTISSFASAVSIKDILEDFRERRSASNEARTESLGLEPAQNNRTVSGIGGGLPDYYAIGPGPELSNQLVMTVSTGELPPMPYDENPVAPIYYWRTMTYQDYSGSGWNNPSQIVEDVSSNKTLIAPPYPNHRIVSQEVTYSSERTERLYWTGMLISADVPFEARWIRRAEKDALLESDMLAALASVKTYRASSLVLDVSAQELRSSPSVYPDWVRNRFLILPDSVPERVLALGRNISASGKTPYDQALAIQNYLREFPYTLDVPAPPPGRDAADYFLFDLKRGYCDYYATAMVVLARAAGLPARIVMGYTRGSYDSEQARYFVTEKNAHAWVEIYFTDIGWVEFEPTASEPAIDYSEGSNSQIPIPSIESQGPFDVQFARPFNRALGYVWIPVLLLFTFILVWTGWDFIHLTRLEPSRTIQLLYRRLRRIARPVSGSISMDQTAHEYASILNAGISSVTTGSRLQDWLSLARAEISQLTELYTRSMFAPASPSRTDARNAIHAWSRLRLRLLFANGMAIKKRWLGTILP